MWLSVGALVAAGLTGCAGSGSGTTGQGGSGSGTTGQAGSSSGTTGHVAFAKTKFALHSGLALGAFYQYIVRPYRARAFRHGAPHRKRALATAGAAALFMVHELKIARTDARSSPTLSKLSSPLATLSGELRSLGAGFKSGRVDPTSIASIGEGLTNLRNRSSSLGAPIHPHTPALSGNG